MIDFYYWPTPNGWKVSIMLEETGLPYTMKPVNIGAGDQFKPDFMAISPNARMPAIVDHDTPDGSLPVFESGAILIHLAEKSGKLLGPAEERGELRQFGRMNERIFARGEEFRRLGQRTGRRIFGRGRAAGNRLRALGVAGA